MNKRLLRFLPFLWIMSLTYLGHGEYRTYVLSTSNSSYPSATNLVIGVNTVVELLGGAIQGNVAGLLTTVRVTVNFPDPPGSGNYSRSITVISTGNSQGNNPPTVVVGPARIDFSIGTISGVDAFYSVKIIDQSTTFVPSNAVVIPTDALGPVNIVMESSTNLVDWIKADPGTYGVTSPKRYFRIRAVYK